MSRNDGLAWMGAEFWPLLSLLLLLLFLLDDETDDEGAGEYFFLRTEVARMLPLLGRVVVVMVSLDSYSTERFG